MTRVGNKLAILTEGGVIPLTRYDGSLDSPVIDYRVHYFNGIRKFGKNTALNLGFKNYHSMGKIGIPYFDFVVKF